MSAVNPYAPPKAAVEDVYDGEATTQPVRMWSSQGRVGRLRYLAHVTGGYVLFGGLSVLVGAVLGPARMPVAAGVVLGLAGLAYFVFVILKAIQRSHDMDWSGWMILVAMIPLVGFIWVFKGGTPGPNRFGAPPPPNTLGVKILGLMFPVIMFIGIVAAIALPAYSDYQKRAKAAQMK